MTRVRPLALARPPASHPPPASLQYDRGGCPSPLVAAILGKARSLRPVENRGIVATKSATPYREARKHLVAVSDRRSLDRYFLAFNLQEEGIFREFHCKGIDHAGTDPFAECFALHPGK